MKKYEMTWRLITVILMINVILIALIVKIGAVRDNYIKPSDLPSTMKGSSRISENMNIPEEDVFPAENICYPVHNYHAREQKIATPEEEGYTIWVCDICGDEFVVSHPYKN